MTPDSPNSSFTVRLLDPAKALSDALCDHVVQHHAGVPFDLARTMVLVPGARLAHALERRLIQRAGEAGVALTAPTVVTPLMFAGRLLVPQAPVLSALAARLSWREVLEASVAAGDGLEQRVAAAFGGAERVDARVRMRLAKRMQRLASEIAAAMHAIDEVTQDRAVRAHADAGRKLDVLCEFAARRSALLRSLGVVDRDDALRDSLRAVRRGGAGSDELLIAGPADGLDRVVVLLADPDGVQRELLAALRARGVAIDVCVHSVEGVARDGFPSADAWEHHEFELALLPSGDVRVGDGPAECAREVLGVLRELGAVEGAVLSSDDVAIMVPDGESRREMERALALAESPATAGEARAFAATRVGTLLARLEPLVGERSAESLAAFVRHDDVATWLREKHRVSDAASTVSGYRAATLVGEWDDEVVSGADVAPAFARVQKHVRELVEPLLGARPAHAWARPIREVIRAVVGEDVRGAFAGERAGSIRALDRALAELAEVPQAFATPIGCGEALALLLDELGRREVRGEGHADGVSVIGWLDAGMTDERVLVLAGFADGQVPQSAPSDPVLPDELRRELGLPSSRRFAARDAWILDGILTRARARAGGRALIVVPRRTAQGDPQKPSRFLLRVPLAELPARVTQLFGGDSVKVVGDVHGDRHGGVDASLGTADFSVTPPVPGAAIDSVRVTAFRTYLKCPYLFQLQIDPRLRLDSREERAAELDVMQFGTLVHAALEGWGREELTNEVPTCDPGAIEQSLCAHLDRFVAAHHPKSRVPALRVQIEIARSRLRRFAALQAEHAKEGWRVHAVELSFMRRPFGDAVQSPQFPDAGGVFLTGRIDRVDHHAASGRYRALDYKTSSSADTPTDTHMKISGGKKARKVEWLDLQLPLYRVLLRSLPAPVDVAPTDLGYINLGPNLEKSGFSFLEASEEDLEKAEELARSIVGEIRAGNFKPSERMPLWANDPLGPIWGVGMRPSSAPAVAGAANEGGAA